MTTHLQISGKECRRRSLLHSVSAGQCCELQHRNIGVRRYALAGWLAFPILRFRCISLLIKYGQQMEQTQKAIWDREDLQSNKKKGKIVARVRRSSSVPSLAGGANGAVRGSGRSGAVGLRIRNGSSNAPPSPVTSAVADDNEGSPGV